MDFVESKLVELRETIVDDIKKEVIAFINSEAEIFMLAWRMMDT